MGRQEQQGGLELKDTNNAKKTDRIKLIFVFLSAKCIRILTERKVKSYITPRREANL
jgi:transcriptional regulator of met regulon